MAIVIFVVVQILAYLASFFCCLGPIVLLLLVCYMGWYYSECIRDSADGGLRAPDIIGRQEPLLETIFQFLRLLLCQVLYLSAGPILYSFYKLFSSGHPNHTVLLTMTIIGDFLYPMAIIGVSVLSSIEGLDPILLVRSIASTFVQYIGLVLLLNGLILAYYFFLIGSFFVAIKSSSLETLMVGLILSVFWFFFSPLVFAHVLGRFYWRYEDKLNW